MTTVLPPSDSLFANRLSSISEKQQLDEQQYLITSPYTESNHLLDFRTIGIQEQLLASALSHLTLLRHDYSTAPYPEIFNWSEIINILRSLARSTNHSWKKQTFYVVVFRSQIPPATDRSHLGELDKAAHAEAVASGGFLKYWFGVPDSEGRNLATCVWRSKEDARLGGLGEAHRLAARSARHLYTDWAIERRGLVIEDDVSRWSIDSWID